MSLVLKLIEKKVLRPMRQMKAGQFEELTPPPHATVFLGDSITEGGLWHEWFPGTVAINRGIDSDTTAGVLARLPHALSDTTSQVFLLIGTNDLTWGTSSEQITANVTDIIAGIRRIAPKADIIVQSVMPRNAKFRERVLELNLRYQKVAADTDARYLDLWDALSDSDGNLRKAFTLDDLHLNGAGYRAWVQQLRPVVRTTALGISAAAN